MENNKNINKFLFAEINKHYFVVISATLLLAIVFYTLIDRIPLMFISIFLGVLLISFWFSKFNSKQNGLPFTVIQYFQDLESYIQEISKIGKQFVNMAKTLKRSFVVLISMFVFSRYFIKPLSNFLTPYIDNGVIDIVIIVFKALELSAIATLIVLTLGLFVWVGDKCISIKFASNDMKIILEQLSEINVPVQFKHVNGVRLLEVDHLLDQLLEINTEKTTKIYRQVKKMYRYIPYIEFLPSEYNKSVFRSFNNKEVPNMLMDKLH